MDDAARDLMELKALITKTLEKRGVLARIRAELRANVFAAIEEEERADGDANSFSLIAASNDRAKDLHSTQVGKLLSGLVCEYLEWCALDRTLKVYLPEANIPRGFSRAELQDKLGLTGAEDSTPLLLDLLDQHLRIQKRGGRGQSLKQPSGSSEECIDQFRSLHIGP